MSIEEIILILQNKIRALELGKSTAEQHGNLEAYNVYDTDILTTKDTILKLQSLQ